MMESKTFGQLALQLLQQASIPGEALDAAVQFRETAKSLATGAAEIKEAGDDRKAS